MKAGKRPGEHEVVLEVDDAAMEPGHEGREEPAGAVLCGSTELAAMEPGHEGREERGPVRCSAAFRRRPQWSPAMKAGKRAPVGARKMVGELGARASGPLNLLDRIAVLGCQNAARARDSGGRALPRLSRVT